jgi:hypothetical protein
LNINHEEAFIARIRRNTFSLWLNDPNISGGILDITSKTAADIRAFGMQPYWA